MEQLSILAALITPAQKLRLQKIDKSLFNFFDNLFEKGYKESDFQKTIVFCSERFILIELDSNILQIPTNSGEFLRFGMNVGETISYRTWYKCLHIILADAKFEVDYQNSKMQYFN